MSRNAAQPALNLTGAVTAAALHLVEIAIGRFL
jgi:hypothetical protein